MVHITSILTCDWLQVSLFCLAIGRDPRGMTVAVVNEEVWAGDSVECRSWSDGCIITGTNRYLPLIGQGTQY